MEQFLLKNNTLEKIMISIFFLKKEIIYADIVVFILQRCVCYDTYSTQLIVLTILYFLN